MRMRKIGVITGCPLILLRLQQALIVQLVLRVLLVVSYQTSRVL